MRDKVVMFLQITDVCEVHEFHVWQLAGNRIIATAHIRCLNLSDYMRTAEEIKLFFHDEGIHSTTIQPEFAEVLPSGFALKRATEITTRTKVIWQ